MAADENRIQRAPTPVDSICSFKRQKNLGANITSWRSFGVLRLRDALIDHGCLFQQSSGCNAMTARR
jgi:hypothetical protein